MVRFNIVLNCAAKDGRKVDYAFPETEVLKVEKYHDSNNVVITLKNGDWITLGEEHDFLNVCNVLNRPIDNTSGSGSGSNDSDSNNSEIGKD